MNNTIKIMHSLFPIKENQKLIAEESVHKITRVRNRESFSSFYQKISKPFWLYIYRICGEAGLADEIFQESFCRFLQKALSHLSDYQKKAYLYRIASRLFIDYKRRIKVEWDSIPELSAKYKKENVSHLMLDMERRFLLLKPIERNLLWLAYVEGFDHREIGRMLDVREKSIRVMLFRARKKFASLLEQKGYSFES